MPICWWPIWGGGGEARTDHYITVFLLFLLHNIFSYITFAPFLFCFLTVNGVARSGADLLSFLLWQLLFACFEQKPGWACGPAGHCRALPGKPSGNRCSGNPWKYPGVRKRRCGLNLFCLQGFMWNNFFAEFIYLFPPLHVKVQVGPYHPPLLHHLPPLGQLCRSCCSCNPLQCLYSRLPTAPCSVRERV